MQFITPLLVTIFNWYICWRVRRFMRGHCPRGRMSCIGVYRRNVITLKETSSLLYILCFSSFIDSVIQAVFPNLDKIVEGRVLFWMWNIKGISFNEGLFLTLPLFLDIPFESEPTKGKTEFYVSVPTLLLPRPPTQSFLTPCSMQSSSVPVLQPNEPSTSHKMIMNGTEDRNHATSKQTGVILSVRSATPLSQSPSSSTPPTSRPLSLSERKGFPKDIILSGKSSKLVLSIPTNKPCNDFGKRYRTTYYCKRHNQVERVESQP